MNPHLGLTDSIVRKAGLNLTFLKNKIQSSLQNKCTTLTWCIYGPRFDTYYGCSLVIGQEWQEPNKATRHGGVVVGKEI